MSRIAFFTLGITHGPGDDPRVRGFVERIDPTFATAAGSPGFIATAEPGDASAWGVATQPAMFAAAEFTDRVPQTLTLWQDLQAVFAFAYTGLHAEALSQRQAWFVKPEWPSYVAWWVADDQTPTWAEAYERFDQLRREGSSPQAFDFKQPFDAHGQPYKLDRGVIKYRGAGLTTEDDHGH